MTNLEIREIAFDKTQATGMMVIELAEMTTHLLPRTTIYIKTF